ncbi:MAG TPA: hypothetical protein VK390_15395 [Propionibacteriaceae bacterium]|nr:hypothetical protein [Propionibacteriaceae bacterium]
MRQSQAVGLATSAAAFATTISAADRLRATQASLDALTMADRHAVHRNLHVVGAGSTPVAEVGGPAPQTFIFDVHNTSRRDATYELLLNASITPFDLSLVVNSGGILGNGGSRVLETSLEGVRLGGLDRDSRQHWEAWARSARTAPRYEPGPSRAMGRAEARLRPLGDVQAGQTLRTRLRSIPDDERPAGDIAVGVGPARSVHDIRRDVAPPVDAEPGWNAELERSGSVLI